MEANAPTRGRSRWFWLPALVTAVFVTPFVSVGVLYLVEPDDYVGLLVAVLASAALAWAVARWQLARPAGAWVFALLAAAVSVWVVSTLYAGIS